MPDVPTGPTLRTLIWCMLRLSTYTARQTQQILYGYTLRYATGLDTQAVTTMSDEASIQLTPYEEEVFDFLLQVVNAHTPDTVLRVAGGWVRDKLLSWESHDIDIALNNLSGIAFAELVQAEMEASGMATHSIGKIKANPEQSKHLETATMLIKGSWVDFVNLRSEEYGESRIAVSKPGTPQEDAERRDLTINALFYNINTRSIEDFTGQGLRDLADGTIRTPLAPKKTFMDDPLRILRAFRFASRFAYTLVPEMEAAMHDTEVLAALASKVSRERYGLELAGMLRGPSPLASLAYVSHFGVAPIVFDVPGQGGASGNEEGGEDLTFPAKALWSAGAFFALTDGWKGAEDDASAAPPVKLVPLSKDGEDPERDGHSKGGSAPYAEVIADGESVMDALRINAYLAAYLLPRMDDEIAVKKNRMQSLPFYHITSSIKRSKDDATWVERVHALAREFRSVLDGSQEGNRTSLGLMLRMGVKHHWDISLGLAVISLALARQDPGMVEPPFSIHEPIERVLELCTIPDDLFQAHAELYAQIDQLVQGTPPWKLKPALDGNEIKSALGLSKGGKVIGEVTRALIEAQLSGVEYDADGWGGWVRERFA